MFLQSVQHFAASKTVALDFVDAVYAWVFRGTRIPVAAVFENLEDGLSIEELVQMFDGLTADQVKAVLDFTAKTLREPVTAG